MRPLIVRLTLLLLAIALVVPATASALTVDEVVSLVRGGVSDAVILTLIDRDKSIFTLDPDQVVSLKAQGVSEPVILAMLKSGREEGDRAAQAEADMRTSLYFSERSAGPEVLIPAPADASYPPLPGAAYGPLPGASYAPLPGVVAGAPYYAVPSYAPFYAGRRGRGRAVAPAGSLRAAPFVPVTPAANIPVIPPTNIPVIPPVSRIQSQLQAQPPAQAQAAPLMCRADVRGANSASALTTIVPCPAVMQRR